MNLVYDKKNYLVNSVEIASHLGVWGSWLLDESKDLSMKISKKCRIIIFNII